MEKVLELRDKALKYLKNAEHGLTFTYPLIKENKVLLSVVNNLFLSLTSAMSSLLYYEFFYKRISLFEDKFESKFYILKNKLLEKYHLDEESLKLIRDLKDLIIAHNESPIEFSRGNKLIICSDNYELKEISPESLKNAISKTKLFIEDIIRITQRRV
jgi:hypothetical protein